MFEPPLGEALDEWPAKVRGGSRDEKEGNQQFDGPHEQEPGSGHDVAAGKKKKIFAKKNVRKRYIT